ncbi:MAG: alpha/beta hydrolase [Pseudomonadota bacterium]|nr:alpha/beta hydrolase [Pseudomonadota bacterium]
MSPVKKITGFVKSFDGAKIYYESRGEGKPIFLCYGVACLMNHWRHQTSYFSQNYQVITFDYRGHHQTPIPENKDNITFDAIAQDIKAICDHLKIENASFVSHSFGAQVIIRAYDMYPNLFHNLIFINGFTTNPLKNMFGNDAAATIYQFFKQGYDAVPETLSVLWKSLINNRLAMQISALAGGFNLSLTSFKDIEVYARGVSAMDLDVIIRFFDQMMAYNATPVLDRINIPTLVIAGEKDSVTPKQFQDLLHKKIIGSEYLVVPLGSHCTQLDLPELVNLRIEKFLRQIKYF